ncbi:MAG: hypothetical protein MUP49_05610 [Dehalococcoidia bacterium]|nr:hypothetical protein [Dehalococcoidia bacterium]
MSNYWATPENDTGYVPDSHVHGTIPKSRNGKISLEFWLSQPRPAGVSVDEWDRLESEKWNRIFGKEEE